MKVNIDSAMKPNSFKLKKERSYFLSVSTLGGVGMLFSNPWLLLAGWVHYLPLIFWSAPGN